jgi:serine/threonine-protein kinase
VEGGSIADQVRRTRRMTVHDTTRLLLELADVLDYVHRQGVVHRDIKPENVLLAGTDPSRSRPVLGDFGVAAQPFRDRGVGRSPLVAGTAHYMSPEQLWGEVDVDRRSDIYSLGVLAYRLLAGTVPYDGPNAAAIAAKRQAGAHPPLRAVAAHVPDRLAAVIERCLETDPNDRWRNARELHAALLRAQAGRRKWWRPW